MGNTTTLGNKSKFRELLDSFGLPRLIIACFLLLLLIAAPCVGLDFPTQITNIITRFSWNAVMVLAMVPMVHSGCGLNFGLPLGIISGLLGATLSIEFGFTGGMSFLMAIVIATPFALVLGGGYGWMLNKIKGGEMMVATYVGFFIKQMLLKNKVNTFVTFAISAFIAALISSTTYIFHIGNTPDVAFGTSVLYLVPGIPYLNSVCDFFSGHIKLGTERIIDAILLTASLSLGFCGAAVIMKIF